MTLPDPAPALASIQRTREGGRERRTFAGLDRNERLAPLPDWFLAQLRERLTSEKLTIYPAVDELHEELAAVTGVDPERLLVTGGSDPAVRLVCHAYVRPGDTVAMLEPSYAMYPIYTRMHGARPIGVPFDDGLEPDLDLLLTSAAASRVVLLANPNQPTGTALPKEAVRELLRVAGEAETLVVVDEAYYPFSGSTVLDWVADEPNLLVLRTLSKAAGLAGLRVGFVAGDPTVIANLRKVRTVADVNAAAIEAARLVIANPRVADDYVAAVDAGRELLVERAEALGLTPLPSRTNFLLVHVAEVAPPADLVDALRARGFLVRGPFSYECLDGCIRVTLGPPELMESFAAALAAAVAELTGHPAPTASS